MSKMHKGMLVDGAELLQLLGTGTSGEVWSALTRDGKVIALKIYGGKDEMKNKADYECSMAGLFSCENILRPLGQSSFESHPVIRLPYCEGRSVDGIAAHFSVKMIWKLIADVSSALTDIHGKGYGHFDVKPSNILWDGEKFMLSDFGACMNLRDVKPEESASDGSSYRFDAPELGRQQSSASDIWSLGATVFYLYMGCHVFNGLGGKAQHKDSPLPFMRKSLPELSKLVQRCLDLNPEARPTAKDINEIAKKEMKKLADSAPKRSQRHIAADGTVTKVKEFWSDQMIETIR